MIITGNAKDVAAAYSAARKEIQVLIPKDGQAHQSRYVTLGAVLEAIMPALSNHGLVLLQEPISSDSGVGVATSILHESGAMIEFVPLIMPVADRKPQTVGSALSYARRYALTAVFGLAGDDDDGQAAQESFKAAKQQNGNGQSYHAHEVVPQEPDELWDTPAQHEVKRDEASPTQVKRANELGKQYYGATEWKAQAPKIAEGASRGAVNTIDKLKTVEITAVIGGLEKRIAKAAAEAQESQAEPA